MVIKSKRIKLNQIKSLNFEPDHFPRHISRDPYEDLNFTNCQIRLQFELSPYRLFFQKAKTERRANVSVNTGRKLLLHCEQTIGAYPPTITFFNTRLTKKIHQQNRDMRFCQCTHARIQESSAPNEFQCLSNKQLVKGVETPAAPPPPQPGTSRPTT